MKNSLQITYSLRIIKQIISDDETVIEHYVFFLVKKLIVI